MALAGRMKEALLQLPGITILSPMEPKSSSGLVSFNVEGKTPEDVVRLLWEKQRIVCRQVGFPAGIRISLHFFNTEDEVDQLVDAVREMV